MTPFNDPWRARAAQVRDGSLEPLAVQLGYRPDPANPARWKRPGSVLSIRGAQFFDHRQGRGGGGAIDLVMHVRGCRFRAAVEFLERQLGLPQPAPASPPARRCRFSLYSDENRGFVPELNCRQNAWKSIYCEHNRSAQACVTPLVASRYRGR